MSAKPVAYWDYIRVEEMLALQGGLEGDEARLANDEVMFIVVHQIDELWFKLAVREVVSVRNLLAQDPVPEQSLADAVRGLRRLAIVFDQLARHFALMETMTTRDYLGFRDKLSPASGFQSAQLRELEILLGLDDTTRITPTGGHDYRKALLDPNGGSTAASRRVDARLADRPTLLEAVQAWLFRTPIQGSQPGQAGDVEIVSGFVEEFVAAHAKAVRAASPQVQHAATTPEERAGIEARLEREVAKARAFLLAEDVALEARERTARIRAALLFIESYRELPLLAWPRELIDAIVAFEQAMIIFRQRHARMVERVIGRRTGTGGSAGVDYLDETALRYRIFREVWAVRTMLLGAQHLPPVRNATSYGFAGYG